jgi:ribosomal protein L11 methyltransferase
MWQVSICSTPVDDLTEELMACVLENFSGRTPSSWWDANSGRRVISVYLTKLPASEAAVKHALSKSLRTALPSGAPARTRILVRKIPRENWAESWKRHFKPIEIGDALLIKPGWSRRKARPGARVVVLDPGLSFGTGQHATTSFCLEQLAACRRDGERQSFLDIGTGSGILAIAAAKLGYRPVLAFDFDPQSVRVSRQNVKRNRVEKVVRPLQQDLTKLPARSSEKFDLICANLISDLLISQAKKILSRLKPGGSLVLAGILRSQFAEVRRVYESFGLTLARQQVKNEWQSGRFVAETRVRSPDKAGVRPG